MIINKVFLFFAYFCNQTNQKNKPVDNLLFAPETVGTVDKQTECSPLAEALARAATEKLVGSGESLTPQEAQAIIDAHTPATKEMPATSGTKETAGKPLETTPEVTSQNNAAPLVVKRPDVLECDVVRFQNNKEKWVAFVGLLDGKPYEIFTGLQDDDEGILLPKSVTKGRIIKQPQSDGTKRYDFQFENRRGFKTTVEGLSGKFNPEYWNYAKLISGVLRYGMPIENVVRLVASLQLDNESINNWTTGVQRALKKYLPSDTLESSETSDQP